MRTRSFLEDRIGPENRRRQFIPVISLSGLILFGIMIPLGLSH